MLIEIPTPKMMFLSYLRLASHTYSFPAQVTLQVSPPHQVTFAALQVSPAHTLSVTSPPVTLQVQVEGAAAFSQSLT